MERFKSVPGIVTLVLIILLFYCGFLMFKQAVSWKADAECHIIQLSGANCR